MKKACVNCKHLSRAGFTAPFIGWCKHPAAQLHNRIVGSYPPRLGDLLNSLDSDKETLAKCDRNDWFEPKPVKRPWWMF